MDGEVVRAPSTPIKHQRSPSPGLDPDTQESKRQADHISGVIRPPVAFPWRTCKDLDLGYVERLKIKERAVERAEEYCQKIRAVLTPVLDEIEPNSPDAIMMGQRIIKQWFTEHDEFLQKHRKLEILVGVEGPTGAGKSSFLGSLLKIPELFPSGQESAATAVIGRVSWNWDDKPGCEFMARVSFRKRSEIENDLESLLRELNHLASLVTGSTDGEDDDTAQDDNKAIARNIIDHHLPKVKAVWNLDESNLVEMAKECPKLLAYNQVVLRILKRNNEALQFIVQGSTTFRASSAEKLSNLIKPFLDSSSETHGGQKQFAAWPLVRGVHIYAKADILKSGITLVDLPGCGDAVESRSEVAERFSHRLDVRMVVSPIIRATDEKQGQALMQSGFDEAQMRIRGRLDGHGFCVIISKMDHMKVDSYIAGCHELSRNKEVIQKQNELENLKVEKVELKPMYAVLHDAKKKAESQKKKAQRSYDSAVRKYTAKLTKNPKASGEHITLLLAQRDELTQAFEVADKALDEYDMRQSEIDVEMTYLRDWLHHQAFQTRNARVTNRLRSDFASRHNRHDDSDVPSQSQNDHEYLLPILPVSTRAFWQLENNDIPMAGFPNQLFTGVPAAEQWLHQATARKRERHLDGVLDGYQNLMTMMRIYSQTNGQDGDFRFTRSQVEDALAETHDIYEAKLSSKLKEACDLIEKLDPLERKALAMKKFLAQGYRIALRWAYKYPDVENDVEKMHWCTYAANIRRNGAKFTSFSIPRVNYTWMETLASPLMKTISRDWDKKMNKRLPLIKKPMMAGYTEVFTQYLNEIQRLITVNIPALEAIFNGMRPILDSSQRATETDIGNALDSLSQKASTVAFEAVTYLTDEMKRTFRAAADDSGSGSYQRRRDMIQKKVRTDVESMCLEMFRCLETDLAAKKAGVPVELEKAAAAGTRNLKQQLSFLVNNLAESCSDDPEKNAMKAKVQDGVRSHIESWEMAWAEEGGYNEHILDVDLSIPAIVPEPVMEECHFSEDEDDDGGDSMEEEDGLANDNTIDNEVDGSLI
ncbi:hypothetical protein ACHAPU_002382 [Fusarium lateritium]